MGTGRAPSKTAESKREIRLSQQSQINAARREFGLKEFAEKQGLTLKAYAAEQAKLKRFEEENLAGTRYKVSYRTSEREISIVKGNPKNQKATGYERIILGRVAKNRDGSYKFEAYRSDGPNVSGTFRTLREAEQAAHRYAMKYRRMKEGR